MSSGADYPVIPISNRKFWVYFLIALFFTIVGISYISTYEIGFQPAILAFWILSNVMLFVIIYNVTEFWCSHNHQKVVRFSNVLYILILITSVVWTDSLNKKGNTGIENVSSILIILGGLLLFGIIPGNYSPLAFWAGLLYLAIWTGLTFYMVT